MWSVNTSPNTGSDRTASRSESGRRWELSGIRTSFTGPIFAGRRPAGRILRGPTVGRSPGRGARCRMSRRASPKLSHPLRTVGSVKILHTSDWHLGRLFHRASLLDEQSAALARIVELVQEHQVELVLIAGDLYDRAVPPADAVELFDSTLLRLTRRGPPWSPSAATTTRRCGSATATACWSDSA